MSRIRRRIPVRATQSKGTLVRRNKKQLGPMRMGVGERQEVNLSWQAGISLRTMSEASAH